MQLKHSCSAVPIWAKLINRRCANQTPPLDRAGTSILKRASAVAAAPRQVVKMTGNRRRMHKAPGYFGRQVLRRFYDDRSDREVTVEPPAPLAAPHASAIGLGKLHQDSLARHQQIHRHDSGPPSAGSGPASRTRATAAVV